MGDQVAPNRVQSEVVSTRRITLTLDIAGRRILTASTSANTPSWKRSVTMRCVGIVIAILTLFVSLCTAQQTATKNSPTLIDGSPGTTQSANNDHPLSLTGSGTTKYIPLWTNASNLTSSVIYQTRGQNVGIGTTTPVAKLDVNGGISTATKYQIGGTNVLSSTEFLGELSVGLGAGNAGSGNTFVGVEAGTEIASGFGNTFIGWYAGQYGVSGTDNVFVGATAGNAGYGNQNVFLGSSAGYSSGGNNNVFIGWQAGDNNLTGSQDIYIGIQVNGSANESDKIGRASCRER